MELLTTKNFKTEKGNKFGYRTGILHFQPFNLSGKQVCPKASNGCAKACLNTSGHGRYPKIQNARKNRTLMYFNEPELFNAKLTKDIETIVRRAKKHDAIPAIRMNGTSDLPKLDFKYSNLFPDVQFYGYTKILKTLKRKDFPKNLHLTFSRSETNWNECLEALELGYNVAVVFNKIPETYQGYKVINGEESDLRFLDGTGEDGKGLIVGLTAKGKAKFDKTGFVVVIN